MIVGDPYRFAIDMQKIEEWNYCEDNTFLNGVLLFFIDGTIFPTEIKTATLTSELMPLKTIEERHYVIITNNYNIDVVTEWQPEITILPIQKNT